MSSIKKIFDKYNVYISNANNDQQISKFSSDVIKSVLDLLSIYFLSLKEEKITIILNTQMPYPLCVNKENIIFLNCDPNAGNQLAYQLIHEFCHFYIHNHRIEYPLLWLEESICEMASYYFLSELTEFWKKNEIYKTYVVSNTKKPYYPLFKEYASNDMHKAEKFEIKHLIEPNNLKLKQLSETGENRSLNAYISITLLPIFENYHSLWKTINYFNKTENDNLKEFLIGWYYDVPKYLRSGMMELLNVFGITRKDTRNYNPNT